jgi:hypothetical protein
MFLGKLLDIFRTYVVRKKIPKIGGAGVRSHPLFSGFPIQLRIS